MRKRDTGDVPDQRGADITLSSTSLVPTTLRRLLLFSDFRLPTGAAEREQVRGNTRVFGIRWAMQLSTFYMQSHTGL